MGPRDRRCTYCPKPTTWIVFRNLPKPSVFLIYSSSPITASSTTHPIDVSESKGDTTALSMHMSAKWHRQKERREDWIWNRDIKNKWRQSESITTLAVDDADLLWRCHLFTFLHPCITYLAKKICSMFVFFRAKDSTSLWLKLRQQW